MTPTTKARILVADDETDILDFMMYSLDKEGYEVISVSHGYEVVPTVQEKQPDLIILDLFMNDKSGIDICREIRGVNLGNDPLIAFFTSHKEESHQLACYDAGADDYIIKPIKIKLLVKKIKALLKRANLNTQQNSRQVKAGNIYIDLDKHIIVKDGQEIYLRKKEFNLLKLLMSKPGNVFNKEEIMLKVWGRDVIVSSRNIDVQIRKLREKIGDHYIKTIKGVGYKFMEEKEEMEITN
jgi:two-component system, OmpR family, alkaline phosphatase synthesis response regulator PhoP